MQDEQRQQQWTLVVGLIDYCRQFTWKEEAESRVKRATVIPPKRVPVPRDVECMRTFECVQRVAGVKNTYIRGQGTLS